MELRRADTLVAFQTQSQNLPKPICRSTTRTSITIKFWVSQFAMLLWGSRLHGFVSHRFFARISALIFCTDFLHGFSARIFCTDFLHGFSAQIFCTFFGPIFCTDFCTDCLQELFVQILHGKFHGFFWGVPKHLLGRAKISPRKSPEKFTVLWGPSGEGLGRQEGEVRLWPAWPGQSLRGLGGLGGRRRRT